MSECLPVTAGARLLAVLETLGWVAVGQRGSHVRLKHPNREIALVMPLHRELKRGTLAGILRDAGIDRTDLRRLLGASFSHSEHELRTECCQAAGGWEADREPDGRQEPHHQDDG